MPTLRWRVLLAVTMAYGVALPLVHAAEEEVIVVASAWLAGRLDDARVAVVHVEHGKLAFERGHIPTAVYLDSQTDREAATEELPDDAGLVELVRSLGIGQGDRVVVYDDAAGLFAARAWLTLTAAGVEDVALLDGQLRRWVAEGRELEAEPVAPVRSEWSPTPRRERVVATIEEVREVVGKGGAQLLDARTPEQFAGEKPSVGAAKKGHIPGAVNVPWLRAVVSIKDPALRPKDELAKLYRDAGLTPEDPVIVYGATGMEASHSVFVLRMLGYSARLYDGSMQEWSQTEEVATLEAAEAEAPR